MYRQANGLSVDYSRACSSLNVNSVKGTINRIFAERHHLYKSHCPVLTFHQMLFQDPLQHELPRQYQPEHNRANLI